jgi:hypothetical protein
MLINGYTSAAAGRSPHCLPLFWWQGFSSAWYVTSVFDLRAFECCEPGVFLLVRRERNGQRTPLLIGTSASVSDDLYLHHGDALRRAIKAGATEVHVHLAADTTADRDATLEDIARGWQMPVHRIAA